MTLSEASLLFCMIVLSSAAAAVGLGGMSAVASEAGVVEILSAFTLVGALVFYVIKQRNEARRLFWPGVVLVLFMAARELDFDKALFQHGFLSLKLYSGDAPLYQKVLGGMFVAVLMLSGLRLVFTQGRRWLSALRRGQGWAWLLFCAMALVVIGKTLDGAGRKLAGFGIEISLSSAEMALLVEETAELGAALCLLLAIANMPLTSAGKGRTTDGRASPNRSLRPDHLDGAGAAEPRGYTGCADQRGARHVRGIRG